MTPSKPPNLNLALKPHPSSSSIPSPTEENHISSAKRSQTLSLSVKSVWLIGMLIWEHVQKHNKHEGILFISLQRLHA